MKSVKIAALVLCIALLCPALISCGDKNTVLTVGGEEISYDMYRYFYCNYKDEDESYTEDELYNMCIEAIAKNIAMEKMAKDNNIKLTSEQEKTLKANIQDAIDSYGSEKAYKEKLAENHITEELFKYLNKMQMLESSLRSYYYDEQNSLIKSDDKTFEKDLKENFYAARQILISNENGNDEENSAKAEEILNRLKAGEDFTTLSQEFNEDTSVDPSYVYYFTTGQMLPEFEEAVLNTDENALCDHVVKSSAGYHIVMRVALDSNYINEHYEDLRYYYKARRFNELRDSVISKLDVKKADNFKEFKFD